MNGVADFDVPVLVVGAGPAGLMTSLLLSRYGVRSLLVERHACLGGPGPFQLGLR